MMMEGRKLISGFTNTWSDFAIKVYISLLCQMLSTLLNPQWASAKHTIRCSNSIFPFKFFATKCFLLSAVFFLPPNQKYFLISHSVFPCLRMCVGQGYYLNGREIEAEMLVLWWFIHFKSVNFSSTARLTGAKQTYI